MVATSLLRAHQYALSRTIERLFAQRSSEAEGYALIDEIALEFAHQGDSERIREALGLIETDAIAHPLQASLFALSAAADALEGGDPSVLTLRALAALPEEPDAKAEAFYRIGLAQIYAGHTNEAERYAQEVLNHGRLAGAGRYVGFGSRLFYEARCLIGDVDAAQRFVDLALKHDPDPTQIAYWLEAEYQLAVLAGDGPRMDALHDTIAHDFRPVWDHFSIRRRVADALRLAWHGNINALHCTLSMMIPKEINEVDRAVIDGLNALVYVDNAHGSEGRTTARKSARAALRASGHFHAGKYHSLGAYRQLIAVIAAYVLGWSGSRSHGVRYLQRRATWAGAPGIIADALANVLDDRPVSVSSTELRPFRGLLSILNSVVQRDQQRSSSELLPCLTDRERGILSAIAGGERRARIARLDRITPNAVDRILSRIYRKLGVRNEPSAIHRWNEARRDLARERAVTIPDIFREALAVQNG